MEDADSKNLFNQKKQQPKKKSTANKKQGRTLGYKNIKKTAYNQINNMKITTNQAIKICKKLGEEFVRINFLSRGNHNEIYVIKTKNKELILRIENNNQFKNLEKEFKLLKKLKKEFSPEVYLFDKSHKIISKDYLIEEFIKGKQPKKKIDIKFIISMAKWYKKLHSNKIEITIKERKNKNPYNQIIKYEKNLQKYQSKVSKKIWSEINLIITQTKLILEKHNKILNKRKYFSIVQGDPTRSNIFFNNNKIKLIDWEFARYDYPETDLVFFAYSFDLDIKKWNLFIKEYKYKNSNTHKTILKLFFIKHYISMINWKVERIHFILNGKADPKQSSSNKTRMIREIKEDMSKIKKIIEEELKNP